MVMLQMLGQGAYILISFALGAKLLRLWTRSRELPELVLGLSFVFGGGLGFAAWFVLGAVAMRGGSPELLHGIAVAGLSVSCFGSVLNGFGIARIFRPGARWPIVGVGAMAIAMGASCVIFAATPDARSTLSFWVAIWASTPIYAWGTSEVLVLARALHKRARLGMADPVVVNRLAQWGLAGLATLGMISLSLISRVVYGPMPPAWVAAASAGAGLVGAAAIWLGFFPPRTLRERLGRAYAAG